MRELTAEELTLVSGGLKCTPEQALNDYYGITNPEGIGRDLVNIYEGLVYATSHVIERVANAL